jgi:hypothetical protein
VLDYAILVPDTALLVPGAAGAADVLTDVRAAAVDAVQVMLAASPARVVVVAPGDSDRMMPGPFLPTLGAAGVDDARLGWPATGATPHPDVTPTRVDNPASAVALLLLGRCGWTGPVTLAEVTPPGADPLTTAAGRSAELAALGYGLAAGPEPAAFLVAGSFSARRGQDAPLEHDRRAAAVDDGMLTDLADASRPARARLAGMAPELAAELVVTAWAPWQLVIGAVAGHAAGQGTVRGAVHHVSAPFGATYAVASWTTR